MRSTDKTGLENFEILILKILKFCVILKTQVLLHTPKIFYRLFLCLKLIYKKQFHIMDLTALAFSLHLPFSFKIFS